VGRQLRPAGSVEMTHSGYQTLFPLIDIRSGMQHAALDRTATCDCMMLRASSKAERSDD